MSKTEPQTAAPPLGQRWYQFTLREMLLAALAFCLLCALFASWRRSVTTSFFRDFFGSRGARTEEAVFERLRLQSGPSAHLFQESEPHGGIVGGSAEFEYFLPSGSKPDTVCAEFATELLRLLKEHGCQIHGDPNSNRWGVPPNPTWLRIQYSKLGTEGDIYVFAMVGAAGDSRFVLPRPLPPLNESHPRFVEGPGNCCKLVIVGHEWVNGPIIGQ